MIAHPLLDGSPYRGYVYSYPHKTAYRRFAEPIPLSDLWADEDREALFLYVHVPFCTMRCGFCNLFTQPNPKDHLADLYLDALTEQTNRVLDALGESRFARFALGGGTPTYLSVDQLSRLLDLIEGRCKTDLRSIPSCVEVSPDTIDLNKLRFLQQRGIDRISIGIQSFVEAETRDAGRPQKRDDVVAALDRIREANFPTLNVDLIYGLPHQTMQSWLGSLREALRWHPEEIYLYPLYVRPLTSLGRSNKQWDDDRISRYRAARDELLSQGYEQISMRMFRRVSAPEVSGPVYCCQEDGMVGLGCGARSYTREVHYSTEYAVAARGVREIITDFLSRDASSHGRAEHGIRLDRDERARRYLIQSLLQGEGLDLVRYRERFGSSACDDFSELAELESLGLAHASTTRVTLTPAGLERSDTIGPWLYSEQTRRLMNEYELR